MKFFRRFFLWLCLIPMLQFPSELAHASPLQATTLNITMSNPTCVQVLSTSGRCSIQAGYIVASGSDPSFSRLEILVNGKLRVYVGGFFESSAYLPNSMTPGGIAVACGGPNAGGLPGYGKSYQFTANAYMADGTSASSSMTVYCPAFIGKTFLPLIRK